MQPIQFDSRTQGGFRVANNSCFKDDAMNGAEWNHDEANRAESRDSNLTALYVPPKIVKMQPLAQVTGIAAVTGPVDR